MGYPRLERGGTTVISAVTQRSRKVLALLVLAGCTDALSPVARSNQRVNATVGAPSSTGCTVSLVQPNNVSVEFPVTMPYQSSACGVAYSVSVPPFPPHNGSPWAQLVFRAPFPSPTGTAIYGFSASYNNGSPQGVYQNGPMDFAFDKAVAVSVEVVVA